MDTEVKFGSKSGSNNRNVKNIMSGFKIRMENFMSVPNFFGSDKFLPAHFVRVIVLHRGPDLAKIDPTRKPDPTPPKSFGF